MPAISAMRNAVAALLTVLPAAAQADANDTLSRLVGHSKAEVIERLAACRSEVASYFVCLG